MFGIISCFGHGFGVKRCGIIKSQYSTRTVRCDKRVQIGINLCFAL